MSGGKVINSRCIINIQDVLNLDMYIVGSRVRKRRNELGLSQAEIYI